MQRTFYLLCILLLHILIPLATTAQPTRLKVKEGLVEFTSDAPLELIEASSKSLRGVIEPGSGKFAFAVKVSTFDGFNSELQKRHFNENYMESEEFPNATFTGKIIEEIDFTQDGKHKVRVKGKLTIHGVEQSRLFRASLDISSQTVTINADILVPLSDHDISIPSIVNQKIATEIAVSINAMLAPQ